ncbi:hypothetical protein ACQ4PT_067634 [Festuca glaucescens]
MASDVEANAAAEAPEGKNWKRKGKHDKEKPWDEDPTIDRWTVEKFDPSWNEGGLLEVSSFSTLFPEYTEVLRRFSLHLCIGGGFHDCFDHQEDQGSIHYSQGQGPDKTPVAECPCTPIVSSICFCCFSSQAIKVLNDEMNCDIIKIGSIIRNKERFVKRRERLLGPNLSTLKAIEILTGCYILVQGLKQVRRVVEDCIKNIKHPVYHIKELLIKRELAKNPALATESWDRFLPNFKKKNVKQKKLNTKEKKQHTPFPPPQQPSKIDLELESGEYFMSDKKKSARKWQDKLDKQSEKSEEKKRKREAAFVPPKVRMSSCIFSVGFSFACVVTKSCYGFQENTQSTKTTGDNNGIADIAKSLKKKAKKLRNSEAQENVKIESYVASNEESHSKKKHKSSSM